MDRNGTAYSRTSSVQHMNRRFSHIETGGKRGVLLWGTVGYLALRIAFELQTWLPAVRLAAEM